MEDLHLLILNNVSIYVNPILNVRESIMYKMEPRMYYHI